MLASCLAPRFAHGAAAAADTSAGSTGAAGQGLASAEFARYAADFSLANEHEGEGEDEAHAASLFEAALGHLVAAAHGGHSEAQFTLAGMFMRDGPSGPFRVIGLRSVRSQRHESVPGLAIAAAGALKEQSVAHARRKGGG